MAIFDLLTDSMNDKEKNDLACLDAVHDMMLDKHIGRLGLITGPFVFRDVEYKTAGLALEAYIEACLPVGTPRTNSCMDYRHEVELLLSRHAAKHSTIDKSIQCHSVSDNSLTIGEKSKLSKSAFTGESESDFRALTDETMSSLPDDIIVVPSVAGESEATDVLLLPLKTRPVTTSRSSLTSEQLRKIRERTRHNYSYRAYNKRPNDSWRNSNHSTRSELTNHGQTMRSQHSLASPKRGLTGHLASGRTPPSWLDDAVRSPASSILGGHLLKRDNTAADRVTSTPQRPRVPTTVRTPPIRQNSFNVSRPITSDMLRKPHHTNREASPASDATADLLLRLPSAKRVAPKSPAKTASPHARQVTAHGRQTSDDVLDALTSEERRPMSEFLERIQRLLITPPTQSNINQSVTTTTSDAHQLNTKHAWQDADMNMPQLPDDKEAHEKAQHANKMGIIDQFITECLSGEQPNAQNEEDRLSPTLTGKRQPGGMEALKNIIFTMQTIATPSESSLNSPTSSRAGSCKVDDRKATSAVVDNGLTTTDNANSDTEHSALQPSDDNDAMSPNTKRLLAQTIGQNQPGGESLERALVHLTRLKSLVKSQKDSSQ